MNTRVCKKCGWEYPPAFKKIHCKFCGGVIGSGYCLACGKWTDSIVDNGLCSTCNTKRHAKYARDSLRRTRAMHKRQYDEWINAIYNVTDKSTLTESQWLEACKYFNGCAYCGSEEISTRSMFIMYRDGGRYCAWNILPACAECEANRRGTENPFVVYDLERLKNICNYLKKRLKDATQ